MNINGIDGSLAQAMKDLNLAWQETRVSWRDNKALEFEKNYLTELPQQLTRTSAAIAEITALLRQMRNDCE